MATCPNKNTQEWKNLVAEHGEDMAYYLWDQYDGNVSLQLEGTESTPTPEAKLARIKESARQMGIKFNTLEKYAQEHPDIDVSGANALADLLEGTVAIAEGKEDIALTEEVVHIATEILDQTNPRMLTGLISEIGKYQIFQDTLKRYRNNKNYQTPDGKPDIRKIKKEAVDKLITEVIAKGDQDVNAFPELAYADNISWVRRVWEDIRQFIRGLSKRSDIDMLKSAATAVETGDVGGTVEDIQAAEIFLQTEEENDAVNDFFDLMVEIDKDMELIPEVRDASGKLIKKRHYTYKGKEIAQSVTEKLKKNRDFKDLVDSKDKMMWGNKGHEYIDSYIKLNLLDDRGFARTDSSGKVVAGNLKVDSNLPTSVKVALEDFSLSLISSYPKGTRFLTEVKAVNTQVKGGLASTIDFMALIPTKDKNGNDDVQVDMLDWKFTSFNSNKYEDLSPGKQKSWKMQMGEYVKMMKTNTYKVPAKNIRKARMVPFVASYSYNVPGLPESGLFLNKIEVGDLNNPQATKLYLLPVPVDEESTGNFEIDQLVSGLERQRAKMFATLRNPKERAEKDQEMAAITEAIKRLRLQFDFDPLYSVGRNLIKNIKAAFDSYEDMNFLEMDVNEADSMLGQLIDFQTSLDKFTNLREVYNDYLNKDDDKFTKEERATQAKINSVANQAKDLKDKIKATQEAFVKSRLVISGEVSEQNMEDSLAAEKAINGLSYSFMEGTRLPARIIRVASNMILEARKLVDIVINRKIKTFGELLNDLEKQASSLGVKAFDLIGEVNDNDLSLINKIDREYYTKQRAAQEKGNKKFFIDNMDVNAYKKQVAEVLKERYAIIDETIYTSDATENAERRKRAKASLRKKIDIFAEGFYGINDGYFMYLYKQNFLEEKHYSPKFKELKKNETAYKVWQYFMSLNAEARDLGYLDREKQSFFPLIEATSIQKLQQTKNYAGQTVDFFKDVYMSRINETLDYNTIDPETGEIRKSIPKYFTKTDKNVEQLSRDLNLVGALWIRSIENYKSAKELEHTLHTMHIVESSKGSIIQDGGRTVYNGSVIAESDENPNANILEKIVDDFLYGKRESATSIGNRAIDMGVSKLSSEQETQERMGVNARKAINSANDLVRLLALGMKVPLGVANWAGTQMQSFIKKGKMYGFREYEKAHMKVTLSDLNTLSMQEKALLDLLVVLNDDTALESRRKVAKKQGLIKYLSTWTFSDTLMLTMQFPEKKLQFANALAILDNTVVIDGKLVNARQYLRQQDRAKRAEGISQEERTELRRTFKERVKALIAENGVKDKVKITDSDISIEGVSDTELARYRTLIIDYNRTLNGMMDENDKMGFRRDTLFSSFMMFKSWIPKLVYVRTGKLEKNLQTGEWDYGRMRAFTKAILFKDMDTLDIDAERSKSFVTRWNMNVFSSIKRLKDIIYMTDDGIQLMNNILYQKKLAHFRDTGQELEITEEEFQDLMRDAVIEQFRELGVLMTVMGSYIGAVVAEPPEDATALEKNRYKWYFRQINKIADEITFYYNPASTEAILQGTFIPAVGLISRVGRFASQLGAESYGQVTGDQDLVDDSYPTKYLFNLIPILAQGQNEILPYIDPELAKEMGIRVSKASRKN